MTTIAYDKVSLAGDRLANDGGFCSVATKIKLLLNGSYAVGCAGDSQDRELFISWLEDGMPEDRKPKVEDSFRAIVVNSTTKEAFLYEYKLKPSAIEDAFYAIGSGRYYALAALHIGLSAKQAVEVATALDVSTGNGVDEIIIFGGTDAIQHVQQG